MNRVKDVFDQPACGANHAAAVHSGLRSDLYMPDNHDVLAARAACSRGDWHAAYEGFGRASQAAELDTDD